MYPHPACSYLRMLCTLRVQNRAKTLKGASAGLTSPTKDDDNIFLIIYVSAGAEFVTWVTGNGLLRALENMWTMIKVDLVELQGLKRSLHSTLLNTGPPNFPSFRPAIPCLIWIFFSQSILLALTVSLRSFRRLRRPFVIVQHLLVDRHNIQFSRNPTMGMSICFCPSPLSPPINCCFFLLSFEKS